jgi:hypothetical protein
VSEDPFRRGTPRWARGRQEEPEEPGRWVRGSRRRQWTWTLGVLALLFVLIAVIPRSHTTSKSLPAGAWGRTIACLERNNGYQVTDTRTGASPTSHTRAVRVRSTVRRVDLAVLGRAASPAAARHVARSNGLRELPGTPYRVWGSIVWTYPETGDPPRVSASAGDRTLIGFCVRTPDRHR